MFKWMTYSQCLSVIQLLSVPVTKMATPAVSLILQSHWWFQKEKKKSFQSILFWWQLVYATKFHTGAFKYVQIYKQADKKISASENTTNWHRRSSLFREWLTDFPLKSKTDFKILGISQNFGIVKNIRNCIGKRNKC